jgi:hypothetical protein
MQCLDPPTPVEDLQAGHLAALAWNHGRSQARAKQVDNGSRFTADDGRLSNVS